MKKIFMTFIILAFCTTGAFAETIYLKDGKVVRGKIAQENDAFIMVETGDTWQKIDRSAIELISKDEAKPVPAAGQPASQAIANESSRQARAGAYLGIQVPYNRIDGDFDGTTMPKVDSGAGLGLILGYSFDKHFALEIDWSASGHNSEGADISFSEFSVNMKFSFMPEQAARPFLFVGIGSFTLGDDSLMLGGTGYNLGLGIDFQVGDKSTIGLALIRKIITYDKILETAAPITLAGDIKGDTTSIRFDFTHHF